MTPLDTIKTKLQTLYTTNPNVHITASIPSPKTELKNELVKIKGVYRNIFQIEESTSGFLRCHTLPYTDLLTGQIVISELGS